MYQEMAKLEYLNTKYANISVVTKRPNRRSPYMTYFNGTIYHPWGNNITVRTTLTNTEKVKESHALEIKLCDSLKWSWITDWLFKKTNLSKDRCPIPVGDYYFEEIGTPSLPFLLKPGTYVVRISSFMTKNKMKIGEISVRIKMGN